jgi:hypothetical protein
MQSGCHDRSSNQLAAGELNIGGALMRNPLRLSTNPLTTAFAATVFFLVGCAARAETLLHSNSTASNSEPAFTSSFDERFWPPQSSEGGRSSTTSNDEHNVQRQGNSFLTSSDDEHHRQRNENSSLAISDDEHQQERHQKQVALLTIGPSKRGESLEFKFDRDHHIASSVSPHCR